MEGDLSGMPATRVGFETCRDLGFNYKKTDTDCGTTTMAADRAQNLQDTFLNHVRKTKTPLTIFLVNGVKLQGIVTWFDNFCLLLRRDGHSQLVYKHAISTIMPGAPIQLFEGGEDAPA
jgi:host factor-I protein